MKSVNIYTGDTDSSLLPFWLSAQDQTKIPGGISIAIKAGNAAELSKYMNSTIELLLLDKEDFYKKNIAETILKDFFNEYPDQGLYNPPSGSKK